METSPHGFFDYGSFASCETQFTARRNASTMWAPSPFAFAMVKRGGSRIAQALTLSWRTGLGRTLPLDLGLPTGRNRRVAPVAARSGDRLLSEPIAGTQPCRREPLFMPLRRPCGQAGSRPGGSIADLRQSHNSYGSGVANSPLRMSSASTFPALCSNLG